MAKNIKLSLLFKKTHAEMIFFEVKQDMKKRLKRLKAAGGILRREEESDVFGEIFENWQ